MKTIRAGAVAAKIGVSVTSVWRFAAEQDDFPKPFNIGAATVVWDESELDLWLQQKKETSRENQ